MTDAPLMTLAEARRAHNIVAAVDGLERAATLADDLRAAGIEPDRIALLGAYPADPGDKKAHGAEEITGDESDPPIRQGNVAVGVHSDHRRDIITAARIFERHPTLSVNRFTGGER